MSQTKLSDASINKRLLQLLNSKGKLLKNKKQLCTYHYTPRLNTNSLNKLRPASLRPTNQDKLFEQRYLQALSKLKLCQYQLTRIQPHLYQMSGTKELPLQNCQARF